MKKIVLLAFVLILLPTVLSLCVVGMLELQKAYASPYTNIDVDTAYNMITNGSYPDLVVLDVRTKGEYDGGHIYCAVWIPVSDLEARIGELAGHENHEIIVYCLSGGRSATASGVLDSYNFTKVYNMLGGISAWQVAGYPVWIATVHNVNTTFNYDTIQAAIDAPQTLDGHTIFVDAGTYVENVVVNKSISLMGENRETTIIDGNSTGNVIEVTASNVNITGFTIQNSGTNWGDSGIYLNYANYCNISSNNVRNNEAGIYLSSSSNNTLFHNNFINNTNQVSSENSINTWDDGYPSGGNYWSDHVCTGNPSDGSQPYVIDTNNIDHYPFQHPSGWLLPPAIVVLSPQNTTYTTSSFLLIFTISEPASWMGYSLDGQLNVTVAGNTTLTGLLDGSHYVVVYANDTTGNMGTSSTVYFTVDTTPPNIIDVSQTPLEDNVLPEDEVKVNATVTDELSGVKQVFLNYTNGNGTWITVNMTNLVGNVWNATIPAFPYGTNVTYRIIAEDNMNNTITTEDLGYEYQYTVIPEFPTWTPMLLILIVLSIAIAIYKRRQLKTVC